MERSRWLAAALAALLVAPAAIRAGAPFGGDDPGCVPDTRAAARCSDAAGKALGKLVRSVLACHVKQADAAFKQGVFDEEACERTDSAKSARARFEAALADLATACPDPAIPSAAETIASQLLAGAPAAGSLESLTGSVYCDPASGVPLDPGGDDPGFVPAGKDGLACADALAKRLGKLAGAVLTCHRKAAASGLKGGSTDDEACETKARGKFDAGTTKIVAKEGCPACLGAASQGALGDGIVAFAEQASGQLYPCGAATTTTTTTAGSTSTTSPASTSTTTLHSTTTTTLHATTTTTFGSITTTTTTVGATTTTTIASCTAATTHRPFSVSFAVPDSSVIVQGMTLLIDYPETQVTIPGSGNANSVRTTIINVQSGALSQPFDLDTALREQIAGTANPLTPGQLFTINFFDCLGATPPTVDEFTCTVVVASDPLGLPDTGVTCSVSAG